MLSSEIAGTLEATFSCSLYWNYRSLYDVTSNRNTFLSNSSLMVSLSVSCYSDVNLKAAEKHAIRKELRKTSLIMHPFFT